MKTTSEYIALLRKYMAENAYKYSIMRMGIFGSVARGEQTAESDVDVCIELQTPSMFSLVHIKEELQLLFGCAVDIVRLREDMDGILRQNIMEEGYLCIKRSILLLMFSSFVFCSKRNSIWTKKNA